jgi:hypothetical protein
MTYITGIYIMRNGLGYDRKELVVCTVYEKRV